MRYLFSLAALLGLSTVIQASPFQPVVKPAQFFVQAPAKAEPHAHAEHGPRGGDLIELGNEEYHIEMLHDEKAGIVSFFLLDSTAKKGIAIPAKEVALNVKLNGKGKQYKIAAAVQQGDPAGMTSCYATKDKELIDSLEKEGVEAVIVLDIGGKQFRGKIEHHHEDEPAPKK
jgi:hypothetical protein